MISPQKDPLWIILEGYPNLQQRLGENGLDRAALLAEFFRAQGRRYPSKVGTASNEALAAICDMVSAVASEKNEVVLQKRRRRKFFDEPEAVDTAADAESAE